MVSDFSCQCHGFHGGTTSHNMKLNKNRDGYWTNTKLHEPDSHPDLMNEKIWQPKVVENAGHGLIFYPKFHFELNYIKMVWVYAKRDFRGKSSFSYPELQARLLQALKELLIAYFKSAGIETL